MTIFAASQHLFAQRRSLRLTLLIISLAALCSLVIADERILHIARISLIEGEVSYQRANDQRDDWFDATINLPLDEGDQLFTGRDGRAEVQLTGRNLVRLDRETNLKITQFNTGTAQLALSVGTATFRIDSLDRRQFQIVDARDAGNSDPIYFEVDTPTVAVTLLKGGSYRLNVRDDGTTEVIVRSGEAEVYNQDFGTIAVKSGRRIVVDGRDPGYYQIARIDDKDNWDRWNDRRDDELYTLAEARQESKLYVPAGVPGVHELDHYGDWWYTPDYGYVWSPRAVTVGWAPYRTGYWRWYPAYGWVWVSSEPWGWAPYHYGRWAYYGSRWCWVPHGGFGVGIAWSWSPALVTFVGFGGGYRPGYNWVGWVPLGPGEHYHGRTTIINNRTVIVNNNIQPRSLDSMRNYSAPGGVSGLDGRQFANPRVVVNNNIAPPPRGTDPNMKLGAIPARGDNFTPTQKDTPRSALVASPGAASRVFSAPITTRHGVVAPTGGTVRTVENGVPTMRGTGTVTGGDNGRSLPRRELPTRDGNRDDGSNRLPARDGNATVNPSGPSRPFGSSSSGSTLPSRGTPPNSGPTERRVENPTNSTRRPDYQPVERPLPPRRNSSDDNNNGNNSNVERREPRTMNTPRRDEHPPSENRQVTPPPSPRRVEQQPPPSEHREPPQRAERPSSPPPARQADSAPRTERPSSPPPARQSDSTPRTERQSSPPPARQSDSAPPSRVPPGKIK